MPDYNGFRGAFRILSIDINGTYLPIGCLTDNNFSEEATLLPTTTRDNAGWETSLPIRQRYNIDFTGLQINTAFAGGDSTRVSYDTLLQLKRSKTRIMWRIESTDNNPIVQEGSGYINSISEGAPVDDMVSFSGNIVGFGSPSLFTPDNFIFSDNNNFIFSDNNNFNLS